MVDVAPAALVKPSLTHIKAPIPVMAQSGRLESPPVSSAAMTQHLESRHTEEDQKTLRRLALVITCFMLATAAMAVGIVSVFG